MDAWVLQEYCEYIHIAPADCPPETGETRSEATEGVDKTTHYYLDYLSTPSPLRGIVRTSYWGVRPSEGTDAHSVPPLKALFAPCPRGRKWMLGYLKHTKSPFSCCNYSPLLQRGWGRVRPSVYSLFAHPQLSVLCTLSSVLCHLYSVIYSALGLQF